MQEYESSYNYDEWFDMFRKISRGSIWDKNHYPNKAIIAAYKKLEELYEKIASDNDYIIDRYLLLDEIECSSRIEIYYKWLKAYKRNQKNINSDIIKQLGMLKTYWVSLEYVYDVFPFVLVDVRMENEDRIHGINSIYWGYDGIIEDIVKDNIKLNNFVDRIIILNFIRDIVLDTLENAFKERMATFDFHNCSELTKFLEEYISGINHITYNKNPKKEINIDEMRQLYYEIFRPDKIY